MEKYKDQSSRSKEALGMCSQLTLPQECGNSRKRHLSSISLLLESSFPAPGGLNPGPGEEEDLGLSEEGWTHPLCIPSSHCGSIQFPKKMTKIIPCLKGCSKCHSRHFKNTDLSIDTFKYKGCTTVFPDARKGQI